MLATLQDLSKNHKVIANEVWQSTQKDSIKNHKIWLDFKNLSAENALDALNELERLCEKYDYPRQNFIIESSEFESLKPFKNAKFYTSYYVPYFPLDELESKRDSIKTHLENVIKSGNVNALSFAYYLYEFMESLGLNIDFPAIDFLTWNEAQNKAKNLEIDAFQNPQVKVILAGEKPLYRPQPYR